MAIDWLNVSLTAQLAASGGTGSFVLSATPANSRAALTGDNDGELIFYSALPVSANEADDEYEEGSGIYTHSTRTIARTNIYRSSNSDAVVDFTNVPLVFPVFSSELIRRLDVILNFSGSGTVAGALAALGREDSDINALIDARVAAAQAAGSLPPDPTAEDDGEIVTVSSGVYVTR